MGLSVEPKPIDDEGSHDNHVMSHDASRGLGSSSSVGMATTPTATDNGKHWCTGCIINRIQFSRSTERAY